MAQLTGGQAIVQSLKTYGVDTIFGLPGAQLDNIFASALDPATRCWELGPQGHWTASPQPGHTVRDHQASLMERHRSP